MTIKDKYDPLRRTAETMAQTATSCTEFDQKVTARLEAAGILPHPDEKVGRVYVVDTKNPKYQAVLQIDRRDQDFHCEDGWVRHSSDSDGRNLTVRVFVGERYIDLAKISNNHLAPSGEIEIYHLLKL